MATDPTLIKHVLAVLDLNAGRPMLEKTVASDAELAASRPLTLDDVRAALHWLKDEGFALCRQNSFHQDVWIVSERGRSALLGM